MKINFRRGWFRLTILLSIFFPLSFGMCKTDLCLYDYGRMDSNDVVGGTVLALIIIWIIYWAMIWLVSGFISNEEDQRE